MLDGDAGLFGGGGVTEFGEGSVDAGAEVVDGLVDVVGDEEAAEVFGGDGGVAFEEGVAHEVDEWEPEGAAHEDDGVFGDFLGLDEGHGLEELVHGAESAGEADEADGVLDEHDFAAEEIAEFEGAGLVAIGELFEGKGDVEADAGAAGFEGALVGGLHDSGSAAGDDGEAAFDEACADLLCEGVVGVEGVGAGGAEDGDGLADLAEHFEAFDELGHDAEDAPGFFGWVSVEVAVGHCGPHKWKQEIVPRGGGAVVVGWRIGGISSE